MQIQQENDHLKGRFFIQSNGTSIAELRYRWDDNIMIIDHTEVQTEHREKGLGKMLVYFAVQYAGNNNIKLLPLCVFANSILSKTDHYKSILVSDNIGVSKK